MKTAMLALLLTITLSALPVLANAADLLQAEKKQQNDADLAFLAAPIKSLADVDEYLRSNRKSKSPLHLLSKPSRKLFLESLTFNDAGLTSFDYSGLEAELTPSQIYQVLALFGAQNVTPMIKNARIETDLDSQIMSGSFSNSALPAEKCFIIPNSADPNAPVPKSCPGGGGPVSGYWCESRATCAWKFDRLCMPTC